MDPSSCLICSFSGPGLHRFPRDKKRLKDWLVAIERTDLLEIEHGCSIVYNSGRVCNAHFSDSCFCGKDKKKLAKSAVPSAITKKTTTKKKYSTAGRNTPARYCKKLANNTAQSFSSAEEKTSTAKTKYNSENTQECNTTEGDNNDISGKSSHVNTEKESSDNIEKEALVNIEKESPDNNEKAPSVNIEKESSDNIEKEFSVNMEKESSDKIEKESSDNIEKEPQDNIEMEPSVNIEKESSDNIEKESSDNIEKEFSDNIEKKSRDNIEKEPLVNIEKESSVNIEKKSADNIENESSVNIEKESSSVNIENESSVNIEKEFSSVNIVHPSIQKEYGDGILNNQPATCEKRKLKDLNLSCPMGKILEENIANVVSGKREPEKIIGATKATGELLFLVKWKGVNEADLMPSAFVRKEFSKLLIQFYEERLEWAPPPSDMSEKWFA